MKYKIFILLFTIFFNQHAIAQTEIKLDCRLDITLSFISGRVEKESKNVIIVVTQDSDYLSIYPYESRLAPVNNIRNSDTITIQNLSNNNKWELKTKINTNSYIMYITTSIDMNNGLLDYYSNFDKGGILTNAHGYCQKIDTSKKKF